MTEEKMRAIARQEITLHEIRFALMGVVLGIVGTMVWLVQSGRF